ncbi:hypothetical protein [Mucilaginibacter pedocola]|uniref:Porin n=1 Tax=Mucilaginibacter pedocola TaxID=1792845 RepID=A0A1S9PB66_9SPHI|nr:hypothetical protein [Mucilaginibacter pedocola]OOQ58223.1 hypothetical protein BC343_11305 [Mucilaginibacter pedocola]
MHKKIYLFLVTVLIARAAAAQTVDIHFNGSVFFDNREYKESLIRSRTYSGTRLALDVGLNLDSANRFVFGANGLHEFGAKPYFLKVNPVAYFEHNGKNWLFNAGMFPREGLLTDYPRALLNDTLRYFRPNVEGLYAQYHVGNFKQAVWIDWTSRQTDTEREQFLFGFSGKYQPFKKGPLYVADYFFLLHDAGPAIPIPDDHIRDNGAIQLKLGANFSHRTFLDSLNIEAGGMMSFERERNVSGFKKPAGFVANAFLSYKRFALYDEFYKGDGHAVAYGDAYYQYKTYNRLDIIYTPFLYKGLTGQFILSFHQTPFSSGSNQEAFRLSFDLGRKRIAKFKE